jgi:type 1 glutamine amidotransferase
MVMAKRMSVVTLAILLVFVGIVPGFLLLLVACGSQPLMTGAGSGSATGTVSKGGTAKVLVFSKTGGFRHASIKDGIVALRELAAEHRVAIDFTEDASRFTEANLAQYKAVIFLLTSGNTILNDDQKAAFEHYIRAGGGYVGVHSASDTEYQWPWYGGLVGAYFHGHPAVQQATINVVDANHPSTSMLPQRWTRSDEWYNFAPNPRSNGVHVLLTMDETTYKGGTMGADHPIAWYHAYDGGRAWYTALGHTSQSYSEPLFLAHLWGGIEYAANL